MAATPPRAQGPGATVWLAVLIAIAVLAFFGYRAVAPHPKTIVPAAAPAPAPLPSMAGDSLLTVPPANSNPKRRVVLVG